MRVLVLTEAGKPVYDSLNEDENDAARLCATLSSLVAKTQIRSWISNNSNLVCLKTPDLMLFSLDDDSQRWPEFFCEGALRVSYAYVLFHLTRAGISRVFDKSPGFDLRSLLKERRRDLASALDNCASRASLSLLDCVEFFRINQTVRLGISTKIANSLSPVLKRACVAAFVFGVGSDDSLRPVTYVVKKSLPKHLSLKKKRSLRPLDVFLLSSLISRSRQSQNWVPGCLPGFDVDSQVQIYANALSETAFLAVLCLDSSLETFHLCSKACEQLRVDLEEELSSIADLKTSPSSKMPVDCGCDPCAWHCVIKFRSKPLDDLKLTRPFMVSFSNVLTNQTELELHDSVDQCFESEISKDSGITNAMEFIKRYAEVCESAGSKASFRGPSDALKDVVWDAGERISVLYVSGSDFEAIIGVSPLTTPREAQQAMDGFLAWSRSRRSSLTQHALTVF